MTEARTEGREQMNNPPTEAGFSLPHIAARFFDTPLLIQPDKVNALAWALRGRLGLSVERPEGAVMDAVGPGLFGENMDRATGYFIDRGVAVIPIRGTLVNRGAWIGTYSGMMSYEGIARQLDVVARDDRVQAVMLDVHSFGGEATGVDDLGRMIRDLQKPTYAMIDGAGASAAYWIAAACDRVYIANSSMGGSIGVVITHASMQQALEDSGITVTHIHAGADKVLGSPFKELSDSDREKLQAKVDKTYSAFVKAISQFRGMDTEAVRATEAAVFDGPELVEKGLADGVTTGRRLLAAIQDDFENPDPDREPGTLSGASRANGQHGGNPMTEANRKGGASKAAETYTQAEVDELIADAQSDQDKAVATAQSEATQAERDRISAILSCDEAANRPKMAHHLALKTATSAEDAKGLLAAAAEEQPANHDPLASAMQGQSPGVSSDDGAPEIEASDEEAAALSILNA
ncbi:MAG TPA: S49 family peptidase [Wenzhouxiangella sp.]|nr:S49 family peptidase [Wenzhouxiangella sp.]